MKYGYLIYIAREKNKFDILVKIWYNIIKRRKTMSEDFVSRDEFNGLKQEVQELKLEFNESKNILTMIDKKIDVITERLENTTKVSDLQNENIETRITSKLEPMQKEIDEIKDSRKWLWRTIGAVIIGIVIKIIFDVSAYITNLPK